MGFLSFLKNIAIAIIGFTQPILAFGISIISDIIEGVNPIVSAILNFTSQILPGGFLKDVALAASMEIMCSEEGSHEVAGLIVPNNQLTVPCQRCGKYTSEYICMDQSILCKECTANNIQNKAQDRNKILVYKPNIETYHSNLIYKNNEISIQKANELNIHKPKQINIQKVKNIRIIPPK